eukprot:15159109-Heterocapsa_arctica.AAC.1
MTNQYIERRWRNIQPDCKGKVGHAVVDLGITQRVHSRASLNRGKIVADASTMVKRTQALALAVRDKVTVFFKQEGRARRPMEQQSTLSHKDS